MKPLSRIVCAEFHSWLSYNSSSRLEGKARKEAFSSLFLPLESVLYTLIDDVSLKEELYDELFL